MYFGVAEIISYCSQSFTLEPGDVIATGTPGGVGVFRNPPRFLADGDRVVGRDRADRAARERLPARSRPARRHERARRSGSSSRARSAASAPGPSAQLVREGVPVVGLRRRVAIRAASP